MFLEISIFFLPKSVCCLQKKNVKIPQLAHLRRKLYKENLPDIQLTTGYVHKQNGEQIVDINHKTDIQNFPSTTYLKQYEIGTIKVCLYSFAFFKHPYIPHTFRSFSELKQLFFRSFSELKQLIFRYQFRHVSFCMFPVTIAH